MRKRKKKKVEMLLNWLNWIGFQSSYFGIVPNELKNGESNQTKHMFSKFLIRLMKKSLYISFGIINQPYIFIYFPFLGVLWLIFSTVTVSSPKDDEAEGRVWQRRYVVLLNENEVIFLSLCGLKLLWFNFGDVMGLLTLALFL